MPDNQTATVKIPVLVEYGSRIPLEFKEEIIALRRGLLASVKRCDEMLEKIAEQEQLTQKP